MIKKRLKICILTSTYPRWKNDYIPAFVHNLAKELVKAGICVIVVAPHDANTKSHDFIDGVEIYRFQYWFTRKGQRVAYGSGMPDNLAHSVLAKIQLPFFILFFFLKGLKIAKKCDLIHAQFLLSGFIGVFIKKITGKKLILTIHAGGLFGLERMPCKRKVARLIAIETDKINVVSNYIGERFLKLLTADMSMKIKDHIVVMPMGVHLDRFNSGSKPGSKVNINKIALLFVGRITDKKGLPTLIDAIHILKETVTNFQLYIVGGGPLKSRMEKRVSDLELNKYTEFTGRVSDQELTELYRSSDIVIVPSVISESGDTEGMPVVILEAMAAGKPIVASNVSGIPDVVTDGINGYLVEQKDPEQLAEKIIYLIEHPKLRENMGMVGRKMVEKKFTWKKIGERTIEMYSGILSKTAL
jgi:glycosyltransferase involved in cell wall biosynthesis